MSTAVSATAVAGLPAHLQGAIGKAEFDEFSGGVTSGFSVISYRGRTWRVKKGGEEQVYLNADDEAVQSIEVVLLKSNPLPSKVFYEEKYNEGDSGAPACWSADGHKPDPGVEKPVHPTCQSCPNNAWGSKISENGNKTRACSDVRRCAVAFNYQIEEFTRGERAADDIDVMLLRIPPATLNPLKDYVEKMLKPKGVAPFMLITKVGFDNEVAYPKLTFKGLRFLSEEEFAVATTLRNGEESRRILNESLENAVPSDGEGITPSASEGSAAPVPAAAEATAKAPSPPKMKPVEEELFSEAVEDIAPAPPRAAAVENEAVEEIAVTPEPVKKAPAKKAATKTTHPAPAADDGEEDYDAMLDSILGAE